MTLLSEILAFIVVGDARYGCEKTPLDVLNGKATQGLDTIERQKEEQP